MPFIDHVQNLAARKAGNPAWRWCSLERVGEDAIIVTGGVPTEVFKSGPRKGRTNWAKVQQTKLVVTDAEVQAERDRHERETGRCASCDGEGLVVYSASSDGTTKKSACDRCGGTGLAPGATTMTPPTPTPSPAPSAEPQARLF